MSVDEDKTADGARFRSSEAAVEGGSELRKRLGGKGAALAALEGLPAPEWFAVGPEADASEIAAAAERARAWGCPVAVRSSAVDEDGSAHSFAGQLESFLNVDPGEVPEKIRSVRASGFSERVRAYRAERGLGEPAAPAVLVQKMVDADAAGVAFAVDPVGGRWDRMVVSAVPGLGEGLVDGSRDAVTWRLDPHLNPVEVDAPEGLEADLLSAGRVKQIGELARECSRRLGAPQDIEWAFEGDRLYLLQSRPVTTMGRAPDPTGEPALWDNSNIAESYGGVTTPLTFTFARTVYAEVYREFCRLMGVPEGVIAENARVFDGLLGLHDGRMYYNLLNWYRLLACFPGFSVNRRFMEQMMGVGEGLPEDFLREFEPPRGWRRVSAGLRTAGTSLGLAWNLARLNPRIRAFHRRLDEALREPETPLDAMPPDALAAAYRELEGRLLRKWDAPLVNDFFAMIFFGLLRSLCAKWAGDEDGTLQNRLMAGHGEVISAEPARRIRSMAGRVRERPEWVARLREDSAAEIGRALPGFPELEREVAAYLDRFADRCLEELKLESPTLRDDPLPLYRSVGALAARPEPAPAETMDASPPELPGFWKPRVFRWVLGQARARVRDRENLRFERTRVFGRVRRLLLALGERLRAAGRLDAREDVFHLTLGEVLGFVEGGACGSDLRGIAAARRAEGKGWRSMPPPPSRFLTRGWAQGAPREPADGEAEAREESGDERSGLGCSPGRVEGVARVVRDPRGVELEPGTVLVAERTDPGWILLFPAAAGLVVERGSLLSHSAIVSRELGLPCVVGVRGAAGWLRDGDRVAFDGRTGKVWRLD